MSRTTVMLTGGKGMLGRTLCRELEGFEVIPTDLPRRISCRKTRLPASWTG